MAVNKDVSEQSIDFDDNLWTPFVEKSVLVKIALYLFFEP